MTSSIAAPLAASRIIHLHTHMHACEARPSFCSTLTLKGCAQKKKRRTSPLNLCFYSGQGGSTSTVNAGSIVYTEHEKVFIQQEVCIRIMLHFDLHLRASLLLY